MFCSLPKRRLRCTNLPNPTARIGFFIGSLAKRRLRCTDLPNPTARIGFLLCASLGPLAKRRLRWTDLPNPTARIGFFYAHLWVLWPSDGCDAPIFRIQASGLVSMPLFRSLGKRRLRCTDLPNPTVRIGYHQNLWFLAQATVVMHQSAYQTQPPGLSCTFWSSTKRRLRCTNLPKPNGQGLASSTTRMHLLVLAKVTAEMHQFVQNQPPGCTHVWQWIGYLHIAPFVLETENSFSPPEFKFCSLSSNYFYLFTGIKIDPKLIYPFTPNYITRSLPTIYPGTGISFEGIRPPHFTRGTGICFQGIRHPHFTRGTGICFEGIRHPHCTRGMGICFKGIRHPHFTRGTGICFEVGTTKAYCMQNLVFSPFSFRHSHFQGDGYLFWGG
jgi:hypothetical protein